MHDGGIPSSVSRTGESHPRKAGRIGQRSGSGADAGVQEAPRAARTADSAAELEALDPASRGLWEATVQTDEERKPSGITQEMIGVSPRMQRVFRLVEKVAPTESTVLITGESGTGKEMVAASIHLQSARAHKAFVTVNCAAIPETLFESELFGHVRGSYTGAISDKVGLLKRADGGTILLDEVAEMPLSVQPKLLRALQNGEIRRVGDAESSRIDVRLIAATNRDVKRALAEGRLREDLYYRLSVFHIDLPPLRERREDIPLLANYFRQRFARRLKKRVERFSERAQYALLHYDYPGNVRELENAIERAVTVAEGPEIGHLDLPPSFREPSVLVLGEGNAFPYSETMSLAQIEAEHIRRALSHFAGNTTRTARSLGISRSTLWRKMKHYRI
ncbi:MAG TPA: sigma-54 dependent transcriptional regulator [Candidatus Eisenbacteria bacterium]|nr:sigma-54 dependent transcriptional regulator [Candidatus Eisenbacteria bacterium]